MIPISPARRLVKVQVDLLMMSYAGSGVSVAHGCGGRDSGHARLWRRGDRR